MDAPVPPVPPPHTVEGLRDLPVHTVSPDPLRLKPVLYRGPGFWITEVPWIM